MRQRLDRRGDGMSGILKKIIPVVAATLSMPLVLGVCSAFRIVFCWLTQRDTGEPWDSLAAASALVIVAFVAFIVFIATWAELE